MEIEGTEEGGQTEDSGEGSEDTETESTGDEGEAAAKPNGEAPKGQRDKRRGNRFREATEARVRAETELAELRGRYSGLESQFNEFRQQITRDKQEAQQTNASTEARDKVQSLRDQAWNYMAQAGQQGTNQEAARALIRKYHELMDQADDLRAEMRDGPAWERRQREIASQIPNQENLAERSYFEGRYPWLGSNVKARALADAHYVELVQSGKRQPGRATLEEAVTYAAKVLGIGGKPNGASNLSRQVYAGTGQRDGEMDNSEPTGSMTAEDVKNNLPLKRLALLSYSQEDPEVAYQKFAAYQNKANKNGAGAR